MINDSQKFDWDKLGNRLMAVLLILTFLTAGHLVIGKYNRKQAAKKEREKIVGVVESWDYQYSKKILSVRFKTDRTWSWKRHYKLTYDSGHLFYKPNIPCGQNIVIITNGLGEYIGYENMMPQPIPIGE